MTITDERVLTPPAATRVRDLRPFWRVTLAVALPVGPLIVTGARAAMPYWTSDDPATAVAKISAAPDTMAALAWFALLTTPFMLVSMLTLGHVARRGAPVLATVGTVIGFSAYAVWGSTSNSDYTTWVLTGGGYSNDEVTSINTLLGNTPIAAGVITFWVLGHIVGLVLLAIALHRARALPVWAATLMALSQPVHLVAAVIVPSRWLDVVGGWGMTTFTCVLVSLYLWRTRDEDFDLPPARGSVGGGVYRLSGDPAADS